ncbi:MULTISPECIES: replicative DNA helicase [Cupriavidus]
MSGTAGEPIFSRESEYALIGAFFSEHAVDAYTRASLHLHAEHFYTEEGRRAFHALQDLVQRGEPTDAALLANRIAGGAGFHEAVRDALQQAAATPYAIANVESYAQVIAEKWRARDLARQLDTIQRHLPQVGSGVSSGDVSAQLQATAMAVGAAASHIELLDDVESNLRDLVEHLDAKQAGTMPGVKCGIDKLDARIGDLEPGQLVIVAGRPGMGKSVLGMQYVNHHGLFGKRDEQDSLPLVAVFSAEMERTKLLLRSASAVGRIDHDRLKRGALTDDEWPRLTTFFGQYQQAHIRIDSAAKLTPATLRSKLLLLKQQTGREIGLSVVDYLQLMQTDKPASSREQEISEITRNLKLIAKDFGCPLIALSQLNRSVEQRADKRPVMSDLRESGAIEQDADTILLLYRDEYYNPDSDYKDTAEIIVGKAREGGVGTALAQWLGHYQRFDNMPEGGFGYDRKYGN